MADVAKYRILPVSCDVPVACTSSGSVSVLSSIITGGGEIVLEALYRRLMDEGISFRTVGIPCAACRFTPSDNVKVGSEKLATCEYRPLRGPLYVPRHGALPPQDRGPIPIS